MKTQHLSDETIQEFVLSKSDERSVLGHIQRCDACKAKVDVYRNVIAGINEQTCAEFDFNLSELVLNKIEKKEESYSSVLWLFAILGIGIMVIAAFIFGRYITNLFSGVSEMVSYLVITTALVFLLFQGMEIIRKYKRQMAAVNFG